MVRFSVYFIPKHNIYCKFIIKDQRCEMKFGSWTYDGFQLDLQLQDETGGDISSFVTNGEWDLLS